MARTSTRVFVFEVMGRHAGWIAAAGGLAGRGEAEPPHIILFPEVPFELERFLERVRGCVSDFGYCVIVVSEGAAYADGRFLAEAGTRDAFGHAARRRGSSGCQHGARGVWVQAPLGGRRLSAALRAPHRIAGRRRPGVRGRQGGGGARGRGRERGDADDRAQGLEAL